MMSLWTVPLSMLPSMVAGMPLKSLVLLPLSSILYASTEPFAKSMEKYPSFWNSLILRIGCAEMREAVILATHPFMNLSRALAMSAVSVSTATPLASTLTMGDLTNESAMSMS